MGPIAADVLEKDLRSLVANILEIDEGKITLDAKFVEDLGMDSMMALEVLASAEKKFKIQIPEEHLTKVTCLRNLMEIAANLLGKK